MGRAAPNHDEFLTLIEAHQRALLKVCWAYGRNPHDRDDLLQEIMGRLWGAFERYDRSRKFSTWMFRVALNVAIDHRRRQRRWGRSATPLDPADIELATTDEDHRKHQQLRDLWELLEQQSEVDRAIVVLLLEGSSHREIAEALGLTESNVGTRLSRLRKSLRQSFDEHPAPPRELH